MSATRPPAPLADRIARLIETGPPAAAVEAAAHARRLHPQAGELARLHGLALYQAGRNAEARQALERACELLPARIEPLANLGTVLLALGDAAAAIRVLEQALARAPGHPALLNGVGNARRSAGDLPGARAAHAAAARAAPGHVPSWLNLAGCELAMGEAGAALAHAQQAMQRAPGHPEALLLAGHALAALGRAAEAAAAYAAGERAAPADARFPYHLGLLHEEARRIPDAAAAQARALERDPALDAALGQLTFLRRQLCDWDGLDALASRLHARVAAGSNAIAPFGFLAEPADAGLQLACARAFAGRIQQEAGPPLHPAPGPRSAGPPRIGFLSNGFGEHPTGLLTVAAFEAMARGGGLAMHLFATSADDGGPIRRRLAAAAHLHDAAADPPRPLARRIRDADIELLVDLRGWGGGSTAHTLALRPAPLQVGWLAYPGTSGAPWIDGLIADPVVLPQSLFPAFSEAVAWLPRCFQPSDTTRRVEEPPHRETLGLPAEGVVYACFNNSYKIEPRGFGRMLAVLREVPGSVLWLLSGPAGADRRLRDYAATHGIDPSRLVFAPRKPHAEYLAQYRHADLFLDTPWYNAHTTASDALWAGCPVLTTPGATFAGRVAASLNHHVGLPAMNVGSDDAFIECAVRLGRDAGERAALRQTLRARRAEASLFDMDGFAADFAGLLETMVQRHRKGLPPQQPSWRS